MTQRKPFKKAAENEMESQSCRGCQGWVFGVKFHIRLPFLLLEDVSNTYLGFLVSLCNCNKDPAIVLGDRVAG